ncbi:hypothetical protein ACEPAF_8603 [Sanghuangporus sanghuang]
MPEKEEQEIAFAPENIASSECLFDVKLSPDAKQLLYHVKPLYKSGEHQTCAIWLGEVDRAEKILFLSDRHKAGGYSIGLQGGEVHPLFGKENKRGVSEFDVSPDGRYVAFTSANEATPEDERRKKEKDDAQTGDVRTFEAAQNHHVDRFLRSSDSKSLVYLSRKNSALEFTQEEAVLKRLCLLPTGEIVDIQSYEPGRISDSKSVLIHSSEGFIEQLYGKDDDAVRVVDMKDGGLFAVEIADSMETKIDVPRALESDTMDYTVGRWKVPPCSNQKFGGKHSSPNVWTGTSDHIELSLTTKLSSHLNWMVEGPNMHSELTRDLAVSYSHAYPRRSLFVSYLMPYELHSDLIINRRVTFGYSPSYYNWHHLLAAQEYLVISPNYRGGQGRGSKFARAAHGGMVKTKKRSKAGVMGAGVSDWGMLTATSDLPDFEADLGGCAPWDTPDVSQRSDIRGNPIGHVADLETAMLILHGEKDERVPASQGIAFLRGLRRRSKYPERHQLVIYPRKPHLFTEKNHAKDVMKRAVEHFTTWV